MAQTSYVNQVLAGFPTDQRKALQLAFEYVLTNLRLGRPDPASRAENLQLYYFDGVTAAGWAAKNGRGNRANGSAP